MVTPVICQYLQCVWMYEERVSRNGLITCLSNLNIKKICGYYHWNSMRYFLGVFGPFWGVVTATLETRSNALWVIVMIPDRFVPSPWRQVSGGSLALKICWHGHWYTIRWAVVNVSVTQPGWDGMWGIIKTGKGLNLNISRCYIFKRNMHSENNGHFIFRLENERQKDRKQNNICWWLGYLHDLVISCTCLSYLYIANTYWHPLKTTYIRTVLKWYVHIEKL